MYLCLNPSKRMMELKMNNILPPFLVDPKYRIWRHLLFIAIGTVVVSGQVIATYSDSIGVLGNRIYLICLSLVALYALAVYFNYYYLVPAFLFKDQYIAYSIILFAVAFLLPTLFVAEEYLIRNAWGLPHRITSYTNPLILVDNLATGVLAVICFSGMAAIRLFRSRMEDEERMVRLEHEHVRSEVNKLKGQITPGFLSEILIDAAASAKNDPKRTSDLLMRLGQLLRYQLYDCNRDRVLLRSEIDFLTNFLELEQLNKGQFRYEIRIDGNLNNVFVSPLLFISLVQPCIEIGASLKLFFGIENNRLLFRCEADNGFEADEESIRAAGKRLDLQYPGRYTLLSKPGIIELQTDMSNE